MDRPPASPTLFPYTTLFRSPRPVPRALRSGPRGVRHRAADPGQAGRGDRKSTRLNSSHANISYAVFCLKKKIADVVSGLAPAMRFDRGPVLSTRLCLRTCQG